MNRRTLTAVLAALVLFVAGCSHHKKALIEITLSATPVTLVPGGGVPITATTNDSKGVNWSCEPAATCGSFNPTTTANGVSTTYTAPSAPAVGIITVAATSVTASGTSTAIPIDITTAGGQGGTFVFYSAGTETEAGNYTVAGVVNVDPLTGNVTDGEQDFNDGITTSPTGGDTIASGSLALDTSTGLGTLAITTNNATVGLTGETFAVQFVNANHALINQFDGNATSSGSLDMQTATALPSGSFSFVLSGADTNGDPVVSGGIFTNTPGDGGGSISGNADVNDTGSEPPTLNTSFTGATAVEDNLGRGTITIGEGGPSNFPVTLAYYVIGPEAIRIIDTDNDTEDFAVGSAFGQGTSAGAFTNTSVASAVVSISGTSFGVPDVLVGQFTSTPNEDTTTGSIAGVGDVDEVDTVTGSVPSSAITGSYTINLNGYGSVTELTGAGDYTTLGVYFVDPTLNINDPNNTATDLGGALVADMDSANVIGVGVAVSQSDTSAADFTGSYSFGGQLLGAPVEGDDGAGEVDFTGEASVSATDDTDTMLTFTGTGFTNDPNEVLSLTAPTFNDNATAFGGTFVPDVNNVGRYDMSQFNITVTGNPAVPLTVAAYQASATQIFWMENDPNSTFSGQIQGQVLPIVTPTPSFQRATPKKARKP